MRAYIGGICVLAVSASVAVAASGTPVELPPEGYTGRAFVDSQGCAFTRARVNEAVVWVARLDATRAPICDEVPTFSGSSERMFVTSPVSVSVAPAPVATKRAKPLQGSAPAGFRRAWDDGRLNPNRGPRTAEGDAAMAKVWTDTVPMVRR